MFVLNPDATSDIYLKMLEFLGALIGMSFRSGILLDMNLSKFVWKQIAGEEVNKADLHAMDGRCVNLIDEIVEESKNSDEEFNKKFGSLMMSTKFSGGQEVELIEGGKNIPLTKSQAQVYHDRVVQIRLDESKLQV